MDKITDDRTFIENMPKIELHLHLEGAFNFDFLYHLIDKYGGDPSVNSREDLQRKFVFRDFSHFIDLWFWKNQFFRSPADFEESTYHTVQDLARQKVVYAELFYSPWDFIANQLTVEEITEATLSGIRRAEKEHPIKCNLIADLVRDYGAEGALKRLDQITPYRHAGVIGIGLGGSEQKFPAQDFAEVFTEAGRRGFYLTAHAGEASGPESVWAAIKKLAVARIGHGVRAIEDSTLMEFLKDQRIPLEVCVTSNLKTRVFESLAAHPLPIFFKKDMLVTVSSDDPAMFGSAITNELFLLHEKMDFSLGALRRLMLNAVEAAFLNNSEKYELECLLSYATDSGKAKNRPDRIH
jgi:adenosine deaminase